MLKAAVRAVSLHGLTHLPGSDFSVRTGQRQNLVARSFHGSRFMDVDMSALGAQCPLMGPQSGSNHRQIGLGTANEEVHSHILPTAQSADFPGGGSTVWILPVAGGLLEIGLCQRFQHLGVAAFGIIVVKIQHGSLPFYPLIFLFYTRPRPLSRSIMPAQKT